MKLSKERVQEISEFVAKRNFAATAGYIAALEMMLAEARDTIERYERALQNIQFVCTKGTATIFPHDTIETCAASAREALNPKEGV